MKIESRRLTLGNGMVCTIRNPDAGDAEGMLHYLKMTAAETPYLLREPEEVTYTVAEERDILMRFLKTEREMMLIAELGGKLAGCCSMGQVGQRPRLRHRCAVAIALCREYWGLGIGKAMFELLLDTARQCGYEQAELEVVSSNERGLALYRSMGFEAFGTRVHAMRYRDGSYADEILMVKYL